MAVESLRLYRALLKVARQYDVPHIRKRMVYNIRDVFEAFGDERDASRIQNLVSRGWKIRDVLDKLSTIEEMNTVIHTPPALPLNTTEPKSKLADQQ